MPSFCSGLSAAVVDSRLRKSVLELRTAERNSVLWFAELMQRKLYRELGYSSIRHYASERLGFSESKTWQFLRLAKSLEDLPQLRAVVQRGDLPWTKAVVIARVATPRTGERWIEMARGMGRRELAERVRRARERTRRRVRGGDLFAGGGSGRGAGAGERASSGGEGSGSSAAGRSGVGAGMAAGALGLGESNRGVACSVAGASGLGEENGNCISTTVGAAGSSGTSGVVPSLAAGALGEGNGSGSKAEGTSRPGGQGGAAPRDSHHGLGVHGRVGTDSSGPDPSAELLGKTGLETPGSRGHEQVANSGGNGGDPGGGTTGGESDEASDPSAAWDRAHQEPAAPVEVRVRLEPEEYARYEALLEQLRKRGDRRSPARLFLEAMELMASLGQAKGRAQREGRARGEDRGAPKTTHKDHANGKQKDQVNREYTGRTPEVSLVATFMGASGSDDVGRGSPGSDIVASQDHSRLQSGNELEAGHLGSQPSSLPPPVYQVYVRRCEDCERGWVETSGGAKLLDFASLRAILCDAKVSRGGGPNRSVIPPRVRRGVLERDHYRCRIRGCGSRWYINVHHLTMRKDGGPNHPDNLITICAPCHRMLHRLEGSEAVLRRVEAIPGPGRTGQRSEGTGPRRNAEAA